MKNPRPLFPDPLLAEEYALGDAPRVAAFLRRHLFLLPLLLAAARPLEEHFPGASVVLDVRTDPDGDGQPTLVAAIAPHTEPEEAVAAFLRFFDAWWMDAEPEAHNKLVFVLEYQ